MKARYELGQHVRVTRNVRNDGTFPGRDMGELLLRRGATGYVRDIGAFLQDQVIYSVDFIEYGYRVGCREQELIAAEAPWLPNRYEFRDRVYLTRAIGVRGEQVALAGTEVEILRVVRTHPTCILYHVLVAGRTFQLPEAVLEGESDFDEKVKETVARGIDANGTTAGATLPWQNL